MITATVLNDGPDPVTIAQVAVDDAFWTFSASNGQHLGRLGRTTLTIPYPWVHGEAHTLRVITSTGVTFDHTIGVAVPTPTPTARGLLVFALIGLYVGVLPVTIGLLWFPLVSRLGRAGIDFVLALTVGLLLFLLVDAAHEASGIGGGTPRLLPGRRAAGVLCRRGVSGPRVGRALAERSAAARAGHGRALALLIAIGIGLHNFGEGLAIGAAFGLGEAALGSLLIVGFTLHNTTEGLAIVAPLAREHRARLARPRRHACCSSVSSAVCRRLPARGSAASRTRRYGRCCFSRSASEPSRRCPCRSWGRSPASEGCWRRSRGDRSSAGLAAGFAIMYVTGMLLG